MNMDKEELYRITRGESDVDIPKELGPPVAMNILRGVIALVEIRESIDALKSELAYLRESLGDYAIARRED